MSASYSYAGLPSCLSALQTSMREPAGRSVVTRPPISSTPIRVCAALVTAALYHGCAYPQRAKRRGTRIASFRRKIPRLAARDLDDDLGPGDPDGPGEDDDERFRARVDRDIPTSRTATSKSHQGRALSPVSYSSATLQVESSQEAGDASRA